MQNHLLRLFIHWHNGSVAAGFEVLKEEVVFGGARFFDAFLGIPFLGALLRFVAFFELFLD
jgi:hypothetical protein